MFDLKKYLVCRIPPSDSGGVARLMKKLAKDAERNGIELVTGYQQKSIKNYIRNREYFKVLTEIIQRFLGDLVFNFRVSRISRVEVFCIHPQTLGFSRFIELISRNKKNYFYVMDNSFFCMMSYNYDPKLKMECLRCINNPINAYEQCYPFIANCSRSDYIDFQNSLRRFSSKVHFLAQNQLQKELLIKVFGSNIVCDIVGLDTGEVDSKIFHKKRLTPIYDFVFHGAGHLAKGVEYFVELAELLPKYTFFIPLSQVDCEKVIGRIICAKNIIYQQCSWETGLKDAVLQARITINPSLWSAPIEGALLKSIAYGHHVATVETEFGYEKEVANDFNLIRLPLDKNKAAAILTKKINDCEQKKDYIPMRNEVDKSIINFFSNC